MLATLGVIIGVGAVVSAVSILQGAEKGHPPALRNAWRRPSFGFQRIGPPRWPGRRLLRASSPTSRHKIREDNPGIGGGKYSPEYRSGGQVKYFERNVGGSILGATESYSIINNYAVAQGPIHHQGGRSRQTPWSARAGLQGGAGSVRSPLSPRANRFESRPGPTPRASRLSGVIGGKRPPLGFVEVDGRSSFPLSTMMERMFGQKRSFRCSSFQCINADRVPLWHRPP
jgi:hypothetical protein